MKRAPALFLAVLTGTALAATDMAWGQTAATDSLPFAGGTRYQFLVPVRGVGPIQAQARWSPGIQGQAFLFAPGRKTPIATARGTGTLSLVHAVTSFTSGEWMLEIVLSGNNPDVSGSVNVGWPGASGAQLAWRNAGPTDPALRAKLDGLAASIRHLLAGRAPRSPAETALRARLQQDAGMRAYLQDVERVVRPRVAVLQRVPVAKIRNDFVLQPVQVRPLRREPGYDSAAPFGSLAAGSANGELFISARFMLLSCFSEMTWDRGSDSDEPYVLVGIVPQGGGEAVGGRTEVFGDVDDGEKRPSVPTDEELFGYRITGRSFFAMAVLENDESRPSIILRRFLHALEVGSALDMDSDWEFFEYVPLYGWIYSAFRNADDIIGAPQSMTVTPEGWYNSRGQLQSWNWQTEYGKGPIVSWDFRGDGGHYGVMMRLEPAALHSLQSFNFPDRYLRHQNYNAELTRVASALDKKDATFKLVPGLADENHVSFESINYPGWYLKDEGSRLKLVRRPSAYPPQVRQLFDNLATFKKRPGLADNSWTSFESRIHAGRYIRHRDYHLYVETGQGDLYNKDATFRLVAPMGY